MELDTSSMFTKDQLVSVRALFSMKHRSRKGWFYQTVCEFYVEPPWSHAPSLPSLEPGFYKDGAWGIRIESLIICKKVKTRHNFGDKTYLGFERLSMCPMQLKLIDASLLNPAEVEWINVYHEEVLQKVGPVLEKLGDQKALQWLKKECQKLEP